jgi:ascorbate-specific PTS system EIIC-type component UlaA
MFLKAPGIVIFLVSVVLVVIVLYARYSGSDVPFLTGEVRQFYAMFAAYVILLLGCTMRGL